MDHVTLDFELYLHYKKRLPGYKRFLESEINLESEIKMHDEVLSVIDEGNLEYKNNLMTDIEYAFFKKTANKLLNEIKLGIQDNKSHISNLEFIIGYFESNPQNIIKKAKLQVVK
tara:strand:- start:304 stop:648 length:345 start_codon:yes stop_codon:yes gene_type:complete